MSQVGFATFGYQSGELANSETKGFWLFGWKHSLATMRRSETHCMGQNPVRLTLVTSLVIRNHTGETGDSGGVDAATSRSSLPSRMGDGARRSKHGCDALCWALPGPSGPAH